MRKEQFYCDGSLYERCTLTRARRAYDNGEMIILAPVDAAMYHGPFSMWYPIKKHYASCEGYTFKQLLNQFEFYNLHRGAGNYTKYFIIKR